MNSDQLYLFLRTWVNQILNIENLQNIQIIQSHQNAPSPEFPYMVIEFAADKTRIGRASKTSVDEHGISKIISDYLNRIEIWEEGGNGDRLQMIIDSIDRSEIRELFQKNQVAFLGQESIRILPRLNANDWIREAMVELRLGIATKTEEHSSWISEVELIQEIL